MVKNFYTVLGLSRHAGQEEIRSAYRRLAQEHHPDRGAPSAERFVEIGEAYGVLGDPIKRRRYDDELAGAGVLSRRAEMPAEPMIPVERVRRRSGSPRDPGRDPLGLLEELLAEMIPGILASRPRPAGRSELDLELILDRREALEGGSFALHIPLRRCAACGGTGYLGMLRCPDCRGARVDYHQIQIAVPAGMGHGERVRLALDEVGLPGVDLWVTVYVRG